MGRLDNASVSLVRLVREVTCAHRSCNKKLAPGTVVLWFSGRGFDERTRCQEHQDREEKRFLRKERIPSKA